MVEQPVNMIAAVKLRVASMAAGHARNEAWFVFMVLLAKLSCLGKKHSRMPAQCNNGFCLDRGCPSRSDFAAPRDVA
jgi:hypothetical protein